MNQRLQTTAQKFYLQSERILALFNSTLHTPTATCCKNSHEPTRQQCVLSLYDCWSQFCRDLLLLSARGGTATSSGTVLTRASALGGAKPIDAIYAISGRYGPSTPPSWGIPSELIGIARRLGVSNYASLSGAVGAQNSPAEQVRAARNYIAHKTTLTASKAINSLSVYGAKSPLNIDAILLTPTVHGVIVFEDWRNGLVTVALSACV